MNGGTHVLIEQPNPRLMSALRHASRHPAVMRVVGCIATAVADRGFSIDQDATYDRMPQGEGTKISRDEVSPTLSALGSAIHLSLVRCANEFVRCLLSYGFVVVRMPPGGTVPVIVDPAMSHVDVYRFFDPEYGFRYYGTVYVGDNMYMNRPQPLAQTNTVLPVKEARAIADECDLQWRVYAMRDWEMGSGTPATRLIPLLPMLSAHTVISNAHCAAWQGAAAPPLALVADGRYGGNTTLRPDTDIFTLADTAAAFNAMQSNAQQDQREEAANLLGPTEPHEQNAPVYEIAEEFGRRKRITFADMYMRPMPAGTELKAPVVPVVPGGFMQFEESVYDRVARILQMPEEKVRTTGSGSQAISSSTSTINEGARAERRQTVSEYATVVCEIYTSEVSRVTNSRVVGGSSASITVDEARQLYAEGILTEGALRRILANRTGLREEDIQKKPLAVELKVQKEIAAAADETAVQVAEKHSETAVQVAEKHSETAVQVAEKHGETAVQTARINEAAKKASAAKRPKK